MPDNSYPGILSMIANGGLIPNRSLGILGDIAGGALNVNNWGNSPPPTAIDNSSMQPGVTALAGQPLRRAPVTVQPVITGPTPHAINAGDLTGILYNETANQRELPGGPSLDAAREPMANAIVTGYDQGLGKNKNYTAGPVYPPGDMADVLAGILNQRGTPASRAWFSSLNAALAALNRSAPPAGGPGSGPYFSGRFDANTAPRIEDGRPEPFLGTAGPYYSPNGRPYWAFFDKPKSGP